MKYIQRDLESHVIAASKEYACVLVCGARQVGKGTMLRHLAGPERGDVSLDDLTERGLAQRDPGLFLALHPAPVVIEEIQYAPQLFPYIKIAIDKGAEPGSFWLAGTQAFSLMELAQESLAGRVAILSMSPLSQHELYGLEESEPLRLSIEALRRRAETMTAADMDEIYRRVWTGGMPALAAGRSSGRDTFFSNYVQELVSRDIRETISNVDAVRFADFIRCAAGLVGTTLNVSSLAADVGISGQTAKRWIGMLEKSGVIFLLRPYSNNLLKRTVKAPKLYFFDTGLAAYLVRISSSTILSDGSYSGQILENYVICEIIKSYTNNAIEPLVWYYRDQGKKEIDLIVEEDGELHPIDIKRTPNPASSIPRTFAALQKGSVPVGTGAVVCTHDALSALSREALVVPVWML